MSKKNGPIEVNSSPCTSFLLKSFAHSVQITRFWNKVFIM